VVFTVTVALGFSRAHTSGFSRTCPNATVRESALKVLPGTADVLRRGPCC
jgi:hypothetical protein